MSQESLRIMIKQHQIPTAKRRWSVEQRLEFIEFRAFWRGALNRADISDEFGVSTPQASADIAAYMERAPGNLSYDGRSKRYEATPEFTPRITTPSAAEYLHELEDPAGGTSANEPPSLLSVGISPTPGRSIDPYVLRELVRQIRTPGCVEILYQSMSPRRPTPTWRVITPHSLAFDGLRWHVRAYCHEDNRFKDFLLSRIRSAKKPGAPGALAQQDDDWNTFVPVRLVPNPELSAGQREAVDWDYNMKGAGLLELTVRRALLYYFVRRLRLDVATDRPAERPVVFEDPNAIDRQIASALGDCSPLSSTQGA